MRCLTSLLLSYTYRMRLNYFLPSLLAVGALAASIKVPALNLLNQTSTPIDLLTLNVKSLSEMLNNGSMTSVKIVDLYLKQIEKHNNRGINLRAVIEVAPYDSLMAIAKQLDLERAAGKIRGPMHGIPILIKGNFKFHFLQFPTFNFN